MTGFYNAKGEIQQLDVSVNMYRMAADNNMSFEQFVNTQYPTDSATYGSTFHQLLASEGIFLRNDREYGIRASNMDVVLNGRGRMEAGVIVKDAVPTSRILFPAAILSAIEDKLAPNLDVNPAAFEGMIAQDDTIQGDRYERPVISFSKPEQARSQGIAQLALPNAMMTITTSDIARKIPTYSLGLEVSDQALRATSLDIVSLAMARQASVERNERVNGYILSLLNGDIDQGMAALSSIAGKVVTAQSLDSAITVAGKLTQRAWIKFLYRNRNRRQIDYIITDLDGALAIEGREGRWTVLQDNATSPRIDTTMTVANRVLDDNVKVFITDDPAWPAGTLLAFDSRYAIHRVTSLSASYEAIEQFALKRSTALRVDSGLVVERLFDDAFDVLSLTVA